MKDTEVKGSEKTQSFINRNTTRIAIAGGIVVLIIVIISTMWTAKRASRDTEEAVRSVSLLYLDELASRREQVVEDNLQNRIRDLNVAVDLMSDEDLSDIDNLRAYQAKMKKLYNLEKFAFVDTNGRIYTSLDMQDNIDEYNFDYKTISEPEISILNLNTADKKVIIAVPVEKWFDGRKLSVCFMEIDMDEMLSGVSMESGEDKATFCNLYTSGGVALTNTVLGGLAVEDNLLDAMKKAGFEKPYSYERFIDEFSGGKKGEVSFIYNGIQETLSYAPVKGTDWQLTYLIRESVISDKIASITRGIVSRGVIQTLLIIAVLVMLFSMIITQTRKSARARIERETADAELRGKQKELEHSIRLQEQLEEQSLALSEALAAAEQASKAKTAFLSNMSHEIRTPMNAIIGLDNIARNDEETTDRIRGYLEQIDTSAEHLLNLINDILDMSRIEAGRMTLKNEEFSFSRLLETVNTLFGGQAADKGIEYNCNIINEVDEYYIGDNMKLRQVLINILGNAVKFTPEGGRIDLEIERKARFAGKSTLQFKISDTGIGISDEFLPHIFDSFAQEENGTSGRYGSSGLGLAITKNIVEMMNGDIKVRSKKGEGTAFIVTVTLTDCERKDRREYEEVIPEEMSVLIVDDDEVACEHARIVLENAGMSSAIAGSGPEAIELVMLHQALLAPYNLILIDWMLPDMDGVETTRRIREVADSRSAIIILTAYKWDDILEEALHAGVDSFISKPVFATNVIEEFRSAMQKRIASAQEEIPKADLRGRRILLAEDIKVNADIMVQILNMRGMEVDTAANGREAVEMFSSKEEWYYDAILMDVRMPEMNGLEATTAIRELDRADSQYIPVIALTANAFDEDVQRSLQAGMNAHLSKPVKPQALYETLEQFIASSQTT